MRYSGCNGTIVLVSEENPETGNLYCSGKENKRVGLNKTEGRESWWTI